MAIRAHSAVVFGIVVFALLLSGAKPAQAGGPEGRRFGLGIILGEPSGITAKLWLNNENALDFLAAFDFTDEGLALFVDYLFHFDLGVQSDAIEMPLYVGIGGKLAFHDHDDHPHHDDDIGLGVRIPIGLSFLMKRAPFEFFLEIAPALWLIPETDGDIDGGVGVRFYF